MKPCRKCGSTERYPNGVCAQCSRAYAHDHKDQKLRSNKRWIAKNKNKALGYGKAWRDRNPSKVLEMTRKRSHRNWLPGEHERCETLRTQIDHCECCGSHQVRSNRGAFHADHDHKTMKFRGFLCHPCNLILGFCEIYGIEISNQMKIYLAMAASR